MGVRNYVGARYVPKISSPVEWQANTSYEALTIVTYNNASYTSRIPVPPTVGNPAENEQYWALTGNYNAQVEQYRQEVQDLSTSLNDSLTKEITNRTNADDERAKNAINKNRFVIIGDSYAGGYTPETGSVVNNGWAKQLQNDLGISDDDFIVSHIGGTGFSNNGGTEGNDWGNTVKTIQVNSPETITHVIFCGGYNDAGQSNISSAISLAVQTAHSRFPNAKVYIGFVGATLESQEQFNKCKQAYDAYVADNSLGGGYVYLKNVESSLFNQNTLSATDLHHPTRMGNNRIAINVEASLTNSETAQVNSSCKLTAVNGVTMPQTSSLLTVKNNVATLVINAQTFTVNMTPSSSINNLTIPLFTADSIFFKNINGYDHYVTNAVIHYTVSTADKYIEAPISIVRTSKGEIAALLTLTSEDKTNYLSVNKIVGIQMPLLTLHSRIYTDGLY